MVIHMKQAMLYHFAGQTSSQMMGYLLRTVDGHIIAIDGGTAQDADHFEEQLRRITGSTHIDAWLLTHPHFDHIDVCTAMIRKYGKSFPADRIYYHFPTEQEIAENEPCWLCTIQDFQKAVPAIEERTVIVQ